MSTQVEYVKNLTCFKDLSAEDQNAIAKISDAVCYSPGYVLFREGEKAKKLYLIVKGQAEAIFNIGEAGQVRVETLSDDEIAGCSALVEPHLYAATERSITDIEVLEIDIESLKKLFQENNQLGLRIYENMIKIMTRRILELRLASL